MGPAQYYSKRSDSSTGDWNEGFVFVVSYHAQLFNTIEVGQLWVLRHDLLGINMVHSLICTINHTNTGQQPSMSAKQSSRYPHLVAKLMCL
ncbi:hypothetical protein FB192DRAFT_1271876 [Mucor lusitanicus]|uniref:Uncharacterized protein n=1 Tax=Mucor circinelloides f. lusitanicus TaxID=29924 RepID=A0A8H4F4Y4_MUCCL|nr:hypothetical protein FB192DRAFT_1271876 [Mucor lusitanicus]